MLNTLEQVENILIPRNINLDLKMIRQNPIEILYFENLTIIYGGFLMLLGFSMARAFIMIGFSLEFILITNPLFNHDTQMMLNFSMLFSIFVVVLTIK